LLEVSCLCAWALEVSWLCFWAFEVSCLCAWAFVIRYYFSELSLEVQRGQDYFWFVEGTCINCWCPPSSLFSLFIIPLHTLLNIIFRSCSICFWIFCVLSYEEKTIICQHNSTPPSCVFLPFRLEEGKWANLNHWFNLH